MGDWHVQSEREGPSGMSPSRPSIALPSLAPLSSRLILAPHRLPRDRSRQAAKVASNPALLAA
jgi:hypothetical protein